MIVLLTLAMIALLISYNATGEILLVSTRLLALFLVLLSLFFMPLLVKGILLVVLLALNWRDLYRLSSR